MCCDRPREQLSQRGPERPREPPGAGRCRSSTTTDETTTADDFHDVRLAQTGDREAFARLVSRHGAAATRAAAWFGAGPDTDDVVQEAFVKAWRAIDRFRTDEPFRPWLLRIVANQTRNEVRSRKRRHARAIRALEPPGRPADPTARAESAERDRAVLAAVRSLRAPERDVVVCRWFLGLSEQETATTLGIPRGTAKSRASRALTRLRSALSELEVDDARG
jgi:RNA polymerase sigma factor (sigma-70 family)